MSEQFSTIIRIGSGSFNDIVINNKEALPEHCHIIFDKEGFHVYRVNRDAVVYINGKEMENRYADIKKGDEIRIGDDILNWEKPFTVICNN